MDFKKLNESLNRVLFEVMEQYAFLLPEPMGPEHELKADVFKEVDYLQVEMDVTGPLDGCFVFLLPVTLSKEIDENLTGNPAQEPLCLEEVSEGAKEILNIIGGNVISEAFGNDVSFEISIPRAKSFRFENSGHLSHLSVHGKLTVDGHPVLLFFEGA